MNRDQKVVRNGDPMEQQPDNAIGAVRGIIGLATACLNQADEIQDHLTGEGCADSLAPLEPVLVVDMGLISNLNHLRGVMESLEHAIGSIHSAIGSRHQL